LNEKLDRRRNKVLERKQKLEKLKSECIKCFKAGQTTCYCRINEPKTPGGRNTGEIVMPVLNLRRKS